MSEIDVGQVLDASTASGDLVTVSATAWANGETVFEGASGTDLVGPMRADSIVWAASMTKAITAAAALQLVDFGLLDLDRPAKDYVPELGVLKVLADASEDGRATFRAPARDITVRHLLTHTSGLAYDWLDERLHRYYTALDPRPVTDRGLQQYPLIFDPGDGWAYGVGSDWAGFVVEEISGVRLDEYFSTRLLGPLGMNDTTFVLSEQQNARRAQMYRRTHDTLIPIEFELSERPSILGGGGLFSTVIDFLKFTRMILGRGELDGIRILSESSVELMTTNQIGTTRAGEWTPLVPAMSNPVDFLGGSEGRWTMAFLLNESETAGSPLRAHSLFWAGLANTYYWIDPAANVTGVLATQVLPFADAAALRTLAAFQAAVYATIG